jgi:ribonuclease BN (tRNA processing enzyme)
MAEKAQEVGHSTVRQTIDAKGQFSVKSTLLTHFGARSNGIDMWVEKPTVIGHSLVCTLCSKRRQ